MSYTDLDFDVGEILGAEKIRALSSNIDRVREHFQGSSGPDETAIVRGLIWIDTSSTTWSVRMNDGGGWVEIFQIDTVAGIVVYPGGYIASDSIADGAIFSVHIKDGELDERTIAPLTLKGDSVTSGTLTRSKISSGAIGHANFAVNALTSSSFSSGSVRGGHVQMRAGAKQTSTTGTQLDFQDFVFFPDVAGDAFMYTYGGNCHFQGSSDGKTAFRLKASSSKALRVSWFRQES